MPSILFFIFTFLSPLIASSSEGNLGLGAPQDPYHMHHFPDPVNVRSGNFFLPITDYSQKCFIKPIEIKRSYNSFFRKNGPFGRGWAFNYDTQIIVSPESGISIIEPDAFVNHYTPFEQRNVNVIKSIQHIVHARKKFDAAKSGNPQGKGSRFYMEYQKRLMKDVSFFEKQREIYTDNKTMFSQTGQYISNQRTPSRLKETRRGFIRLFETGEKEYFNKDGRLIKTLDRNQNHLLFKYNKNRKLIQISDSCNQWVRLFYNSSNKIERIQDKYHQKVRYSYDRSDRLLSVIGVDAQKISFSYDQNDRLVKVKFGAKDTVRIEYDPKNGKTLRQHGPGNKETRYLYKNTSGILSTQITDNQGLNHLYEYNDGQNQISFTDSSKGKNASRITTQFMACCGKPLSILNQNGKGDRFTYDLKKRLIRKVHSSGQESLFTYNKKFNLPKKIVNGNKKFTQFEYDSKGNPIFISNEKFDFLRMTYENHGEIRSLLGKNGTSIKFFHDKKGNVVKIQKLVSDKIQASLIFHYDLIGNLLKKTSVPRNKPAEKDIQSSIQNLIQSFDFSIINLDF